MLPLFSSSRPNSNPLSLASVPTTPPNCLLMILLSFSQHSFFSLQWDFLPSFPFRMLLLLSHFSHVRLCATPWTIAHQAPPSLGFSRQEHWSGLPFLSPGSSQPRDLHCRQILYHLSHQGSPILIMLYCISESC